MEQRKIILATLTKIIDFLRKLKGRSAISWPKQLDKLDGS